MTLEKGPECQDFPARFFRSITVDISFAGGQRCPRDRKFVVNADTRRMVWSPKSASQKSVEYYDFQWKPPKNPGRQKEISFNFWVDRWFRTNSFSPL